jgi:uncharacterized repeat protein (TIGR01451 family)
LRVVVKAIVDRQISTNVLESGAVAKRYNACYVATSFLRLGDRESPCVLMLARLSALARLGFIGVCMLFAGFVQAQTTYGISRTATFIIDPLTGAATAPPSNNFGTPLGYESSAMAVSPLNGLLYVIERTGATNLPRIGTWNPATGVSVNLGAVTGPTAADILRATFCPDGRFYIAGNGGSGGSGAEVFEINPTTLAVVRTISAVGVATGGSGDISCVSNGDLYFLSATGTGGTYTLSRLTAAQLATGGSPTVAVIGNLGAYTSSRDPNGLVEVPSGTAGCAPAPAPCLLSSGTPAGQVIYSINSSTGAASTLTTASGAGMVDLSRGFPLGLTVSKTQSPSTVIQGTQTITYSILVSNAGPAVVQNATVTDNLSTAFSTVTWVCGVAAPGVTTTVVTTACSSASGTGNINNTVSLSINGAVRYTITAVLRSTFTGTLSNIVNGTTSSLLTVVTPTATISTVTATVQPAASLSVAKTDGITTTVAGATLNYTVTFSNFGPGNADGAQIQDTPSAGLSNCSVISCTPAGSPTPATCPATPALSLAPSSTTIPSFPANSSITLVVRCGVTATGL